MAQLDALAAGDPSTQLVDFVVAAEDEKEGLQIADYVVVAGGHQRCAQPSRPAARAVVGGVDYAVGGWGEYEICRRRARWEAAKAQGAARPGAAQQYAGRAYISAADAAGSILCESRATLGGAEGGAPSALRRAARGLAQELGRLEDKLCSPDEEGVWECVPPAELRPATKPQLLLTTVPALTSTDLQEFAADPVQETDPEILRALGDDVISLAASVGLPLPELRAAGPLPALPARVVPVTDEEGILRLEGAVAPYVSAVEDLQAALASQLEATTIALRAALATLGK